MRRTGTAVFFAMLIMMANAQPKNVHSPLYTGQVNGKTVFKIAKPDYTLSPLTGMTRRNWKDAAAYLLEGAFSYIHNLDDPMQFPKQPGKSYPRTASQIPTEKLEGLCRTLFIAAPLLKENPALEINGIKVAEYYRHNILNLLDSTKISYIKPQAKGGGPSQVLVEFGALSVSMFYIPEVLFDPLPQDKKDLLAATMLSYGDGKTVGSNWKFFNIFVLSFFKSRGYTVNEKLLVEYLDKSLAHYRGNGWYNDAPAYDYYSMWAFQMYGPLWSSFFGKKYYPAYAAQFMNNFREVKNSYPYMFGRDGKMIMWGRSMPYRFGSAIPFPLMGLENDAAVNYGWMRRIASGVLLQFLQHPDFLKDDVPTLGFYGAFEPAVQPYSCRGSAFWMGKAFLGLMIPEDNAFWTATENDGAWENEMQQGKVYNRYLDSSHILITDYPNTGISEIRAWCRVKAIDANEPFRASENYNRLSYNSAFPWQADSVQGVVAMNYIVQNKKNEWEPLRLYDFKKYENGIYYRDAVLETNPNMVFNLADISLPNGILRVDRITTDSATVIKLGHYALPQLQSPVKTTAKKIQGHDVLITDNGVYQLAMVNYAGWQSVDAISTSGVHPESSQSVVMNATGKTTASTQYYVTLLLWKKSGEKWRNKELVPVKKMQVDDGAKKIMLYTGRNKVVVNWF